MRVIKGPVINHGERGSAEKREMGGQVKFHPYKMGGGGGHNTF